MNTTQRRCESHFRRSVSVAEREKNAEDKMDRILLSWKKELITTKRTHTHTRITKQQKRCTSVTKMSQK